MKKTTRTTERLENDAVEISITAFEHGENVIIDVEKGAMVHAYPGDQTMHISLTRVVNDEMVVINAEISNSVAGELKDSIQSHFDKLLGE